MASAALWPCSAENIFSNLQFWKICGFSRIAFSRVGFWHKPSQASRFARYQLPRRGSFLCSLPCRAQHDFEWPPLRSGHVQRKDYFKFSRLLHSAERDRRFFHRRGRSRELHLQRLLPAEVRRCPRRPLGGAGTAQAVTEGVCCPTSPSLLLLIAATL